MKTGIDLISEERQRQIVEEGWTLDHDTDHDEGDLAMAAIAYINADETDIEANEGKGDPYTMAYSWWPWGIDSWKPKDRLRNLIRAGALIAAEIDRLQNTP